MADLTPLLAYRWSPLAFHPTAELSAADASSLLEAARWAPSLANRQPWRFTVGYRNDDTWKRILVNLTERDQRWAHRAAALLLAAHVDPDAAPADGIAYDLGQAVAHLTVQATALGLHVRQVLTVDRGGLTADLHLPIDVRPYAVLVVGQLGDPLSLPADLVAEETGLRRRRPLADLLLG
ncbi:nitroreductase family protein [Micromonospora violae]|uniref:Nitroreductase family protein n=1 Tax=Micromonospora violae TaxID=1278207 RepID=A0A4Q7UJN3_9ACTN|nr:nitroreductase family protein [Micromonospora violae]RZT81595.1 nitroreductase family protein [Micromonospora violae]